jgi:hypothetical protein
MGSFRIFPNAKIKEDKNKGGDRTAIQSGQCAASAGDITDFSKRLAF